MEFVNRIERGARLRLSRSGIALCIPDDCRQNRDYLVCFSRKCRNALRRPDTAPGEDPQTHMTLACFLEAY